MSKMDQLNTPERTTTVELTAKIPGLDGLLDKIIAEVERLESENFNNATVTGHSLPFNHTYDSMHLNETIAEFGPEFPTVNVDAGFSDRTSVDNKNNLPETNQTTVDANFDKRICEKIIPTINDSAIPGNSIGPGAEFVAALHHLQWQNAELQDQVMQQELRKPLNALPDIHRLNLQTSTGDRLKRQETTEINQEQEPAAGLIYRPQIEIAQVDTTMTNEQSIIIDCSQTNQLEDIESGKSSTEDETETGSVSKEVKQSEHVGSSLQEHNFNRSDGSLKDRSARIRGSGGKRIKFNVVESIEESPTNARNSRNHSKSYTCGECKKQFNSRTNFNKHFKIHAGRKPYLRMDCGDVSIQDSQLKRHQRTHTGDVKKKLVEKTYVCKDCGKAFKQPCLLIRHQRKHTGEKPYKCEKCEAAFATSGTLRSHLRTHSAETPFICNICKKSFRLKRDLSQHMYTHSGETFHNCNECQHVYRHPSTLRRHILRKH